MNPSNTLLSLPSLLSSLLFLHSFSVAGRSASSSNDMDYFNNSFMPDIVGPLEYNSYVNTGAHKIAKNIYECIKEVCGGHISRHGSPFCSPCDDIFAPHFRGKKINPLRRSADVPQNVYFGFSLICTLLPGEYFFEYYRAFRDRDFLKCFNILSFIFNNTTNKEIKVLERITYFSEVFRLNSKRHGGPDCLCYIMFFDCDKDYAEIIKRKGCPEKTVCNNMEYLYSSIFLPVFVLDQQAYFRDYSLEVDRRILELIAYMLPEYKAYVGKFNAELREFVRRFWFMTPSERTLAIIRLKYFSYHLISMVICCPVAPCPTSCVSVVATSLVKILVSSDCKKYFEVMGKTLGLY